MKAKQAKQPAAYYGLLALSAALSLLALVTLLPNPAASKPNVFGYRSVCSFAPAATVVCALAAGATCTVRNRLISRRASVARYRPLIIPAATAVLLIAVFAVFAVRFFAIQSRFISISESAAPAGAAFAGLADGTRSATASEGDVSATVELTASGGRIDRLSLTAAKNVEPAVAAVLFEAVKVAQSSQVDAVSGATASSRVLLQAIEKAAFSP